MVAVTITSLVMAVAVPRLSDSKRKARATAVVADFRTFSAAFDAYAQENGAFPDEAEAGELPTQMVGRISPAAWQKVTPVGGQYNWDNNQQHYGVTYRAAISITETASAPLALDVDQLESIDRLCDDGDLYNGSFRLGAEDVPLWVISR